MPMYSEPSETYKMKLIIFVKSPTLDAREEMAQTFDVTLSHSSIYLLIYSCVSYSHLLNQAYYFNQRFRAFSLQLTRPFGDPCSL